MVHIPVFFRRHPGLFLELLDKMTLGRERKTVCNIAQRILAVAEHIFRHLDLLRPDVRADRISRLFFKQAGEIAGGHAKLLRNFFNGDSLFDMRVNIFLTHIDMAGACVAAADPAHLLRVVQYHLVMQMLYLLQGMNAVQTLDIEIAHPKSLFQFHSPLSAEPRDHRRGNHKMIFQVCDRVLRQHAHALIIHKALLLAVFSDRLHIAAHHRLIKQKFLRRLAVLHLVNHIIRFQKKPFVLVSHTIILPNNICVQKPVSANNFSTVANRISRFIQLSKAFSRSVQSRRM